MAKILVTGAAGFIGYHTSERLLARGDEVVGLDNVNDYYDPTLKEARIARLSAKPGFRLFRMDLADRDGVARLFREERFDRVINLAAQAGVRYSITNPHAYIESNLVEVYVQRLRAKIDKDRESKLLRTVRGAGSSTVSASASASP